MFRLTDLFQRFFFFALDTTEIQKCSCISQHSPAWMCEGTVWVNVVGLSKDPAACSSVSDVQTSTCIPRVTVLIRPPIRRLRPSITLETRRALKSYHHMYLLNSA